MQIKETIQVLREQIENYKPYFMQKIKENDFHAISDAANDCRELSAKIEMLQSLQAVKAPAHETKWPKLGDIFGDIQKGLGDRNGPDLSGESV